MRGDRRLGGGGGSGSGGGGGRGGGVGSPAVSLTWGSSSPERSRSGAAWPSPPGRRTRGRRFDASVAPNWKRHRTQWPQSQRKG